MKFEDSSQNLRARLRFVQILVVLMLGVLTFRLYVLQVVRGERYAEIAENQRRRRLPIPAPRGVIFDREGKALVDSRPIYNVILMREDVKGKDLYALIEPLSSGLMVEPDILKERFDVVKSMPAFESIKIKEGASPGDIAWVEAHTLEFPELRVEQQPQRSYPANGSLAHVLGYVGEISPEQLNQQVSKDKGLKPGDIIGLSGIEQIYDDYLRGTDGYREVLVDSRGRIQAEIEIDRGDEIASGYRIDDFDLGLNASATVDHHFAVTVFAAQVVVVDLFETTQTDDVAGFESFIFCRLLLELFGTDLADVAKHVGQRAVCRITALRLFLNTQFRILESVRFNPGDVARRRTFFDLDRFERRHRLHQVEAFLQDIWFNHQAGR